MIGMVVFDEEEYKNDIKLRGMIQAFKKHGTNITGFLYQPSKNDKLENILNTIQFCTSELSGNTVLILLHALYGSIMKKKKTTDMNK